MYFRRVDDSALKDLNEQIEANGEVLDGRGQSNILQFENGKKLSPKSSAAATTILPLTH